jgi:poly-gamma-glutamate synthesis protein (capsule biosynthesis protein)
MKILTRTGIRVLAMGVIAAFMVWSPVPMRMTRARQGNDSLSERPARDTIVLRFAGDCLLAGHYESDVGDDPGRAFENFDLLRNADVAMVNLECPVTLRGSRIIKPYNFRMNPLFLGLLKEAGVDIVNIANNHIFDYGKVGLFDTISYLDSVGILHVGGGRNRNEARTPVIVTLGGRKFAFLGCYGGGEAPTAAPGNAGVARPDIPLLMSDIRSLRTRDSAQFVLVNIHWGTEKATTPDARQVDLAHRMIDAGADAVIGHHPHVLQGIERYKNGVIAYSLGNFIFGGNSRSTYDTGLLEIFVTKDSVQYRLLPVRIIDWKATALQGDAATNVLQHVAHLSRIFKQSIFAKEESR